MFHLKTRAKENMADGDRSNDTFPELSGLTVKQGTLSCVMSRASFKSQTGCHFIVTAVEVYESDFCLEVIFSNGVCEFRQNY